MNHQQRNLKIIEIKQELAVSDFDMARVVDDIVNTLCKAGILSCSSFSDITRAKLERRAFLRQELFELCRDDLEENSQNINHSADTL